MDLFARQIKQSHRTLNLCLCQSSSLFAYLDHNDQCTTKWGIILVKTTWFDLTNKMVLTKTLQWPWWMQKKKKNNCGHGIQITLLLLSISNSVTGIESYTDNKTHRRVRFKLSDLCYKSFSWNLGTFCPDLAVKRQETTRDIGEKYIPELYLDIFLHFKIFGHLNLAVHKIYCIHFKVLKSITCPLNSVTSSGYLYVIGNNIFFNFAQISANLNTSNNNDTCVPRPQITPFKDVVKFQSVFFPIKKKNPHKDQSCRERAHAEQRWKIPSRQTFTEEDIHNKSSKGENINKYKYNWHIRSRITSLYKIWNKHKDIVNIHIK